MKVNKSFQSQLKDVKKELEKKGQLKRHSNKDSIVTKEFKKLNKNTAKLKTVVKVMKEEKVKRNLLAKIKAVSKMLYSVIYKDYTDAEKKKIEQVMSEFKEGTLKTRNGRIVTDRDQAVAIAMREIGAARG